MVVVCVCTGVGCGATKSVSRVAANNEAQPQNTNLAISLNSQLRIVLAQALRETIGSLRFVS